MLMTRKPKEILFLAAEEYFKNGPNSNQLRKLEEAYIYSKKDGEMNTLIAAILVLFLGGMLTSIGVQIFNEASKTGLLFTGILITGLAIVKLFYLLITLNNTQQYSAQFNRNLIRTLTQK